MHAEEKVLHRFSAARLAFAGISVGGLIGVALPWVAAAAGGKPPASNLADPVLAAVALFQTGVVVALCLYGWRWVQMLTQVTVAPDRIRLPFRRNRERKGWRSLEEIFFIGSDPIPSSIANAELAFERLSSKPKRIGRFLLEQWKQRGQTLVLGEADALRVKLPAEVARAVEEHWRTG